MKSSTGRYSNGHNDEYDEYTDYSCSTFLERLARDVETILHQWHVDGGSDRHFSANLASSQNQHSTGTNQNTTSSATGAATASGTFNKQTAKQDHYHLIKLRSERILWNISLHYTPPSSSLYVHNHSPASGASVSTRVNCDLELELNLWDGPPPRKVFSTDNASGSTSDTSSLDLVYSLQRRAVVAYPHLEHNNNEAINENERYDDWFESFATLFGIGQHITLTPVNPWSLSDALQPLNPAYKLLLDYLTHCAFMAQSTMVDSSSSSTDHSMTNDANACSSSVLLSPTTAILTGWLQAALNLAASHGDCQFPLFGLWGSYAQDEPSARQPASVVPASMPVHCTTLEIYPSWMKASRHGSFVSLDVWRDIRFRRARAGLSLSRIASSQSTCLSGNVWSSSDNVTSSFWCGIVPNTTTRSSFDWTLWGDLLRSHSRPVAPPSVDGTTIHLDEQSLVCLWQARHTYIWCKQQPQRHSLLWQALGVGRTQHVHEWRTGTAGGAIATMSRPEVESSNATTATAHREAMAELLGYLWKCQRYALQLLEHAAGSSDDDALWGPLDDPVASVQLLLTWKPVTATTGSSNAERGTDYVETPLLTLPLQSRHQQSAQDRQEMLEATELAILDPHAPSTTRLQVRYDPTVTHATQATTQRCVLAALIRTATLPKETLLSHLIDETIMDRWDTAAGNRIASIFSKKSSVDKATRSLVAAMDWKHAASDMIEPWQADEIVRKVLDDAASALGFPVPPDNTVSVFNDTNMIKALGQAEGMVWEPLRKGAPPGRLLSLLFVHMARVRSPSSMAMVWIAFVHEMRRRWETRESLPNMNYVPGLDPSPHTSGSLARECFSTVGGSANLSAQVHSSEPDPDDFHCLIGQKLQVFNLGLESVVSAELRQVEQLEKRQRLHSSAELRTGSTHSLASAPRTLLNGAIVDGVPMVDNTMDANPDDAKSVASDSKSNQSQEFYDADDTENFFRFVDASRDLGLERRGARCPVQGVFLTATGDQLYAPYLQRPFPLTDDIIAERRLILSRQGIGGKSGTTINLRLEILQRFQQPKLHSDMRSFKAANPGAIFDDFVHWYGNPNDSLTELIETGKASNDSRDSSTGEKLERANKGAQALEQTRIFWAQTWEAATPLPASEQEPLFVAESTVEMTLDYLETIHPASLLCQVLAVNLALSYFILAASAGTAAHVRSVRASLTSLRETVDDALQLLASDAAMSTENIHKTRSSPDMMASIESIAACTRACESLTAVEVIVSRATSLLHKLPQQYDLVEAIMQRTEGTTHRVDTDTARSAFLQIVHVQQCRLSKTKTGLKPAVREYMLRNMDDTAPCQLCVRTSDEGINVLGSNQGGTVLALTKTTNDRDPSPSPVTRQYSSSGLFTI